MIAKSLTKLAAVSAFALWAGAAQANAFNIDLSGTAGGFSNETIDCCGAHYDQFFENLTGLNADNAFSVQQGDTIDATVTFDTAVTIPASITRTNVNLFLFGSQFPAESTGDNGPTTLFLGGNQVAQLNEDTGTFGALASGGDFFPPNNGPLTFDTINFSFTINNLATPATLDSSEFDFSLVSPAAATVPEPAAWALMLMGFGAMGAALRSRRQRRFA
jgi:hypothetical protein